MSRNQNNTVSVCPPTLHRGMRFIVFSFVIFLASLSHVAAEDLVSPGLEKRLESLLEFDVPIITIDELASRISDDMSPKPVLLDSRSPREYAVSRINGAVFVGYDDFEIDTVRAPKTAEIVVYCAVGFRSEKVAEDLLKAGYTNVRNLYGGIFEWVNRGHAVVNDHGETERVHAYSLFWRRHIEDGDAVLF